MAKKKTGRPRHPVTTRIDDAVDLIERVGGDVTLPAVMINAEKTITLADWKPGEPQKEALQMRVYRRLRDRGYVISDTDTRIRKSFWGATVEELEAQQKIKVEAAEFDGARLRADEQVIRFLQAKRDELGYEVYPGLFAEEIDRIYRMNGVTAPTH